MIQNVQEAIKRFRQVAPSREPNLDALSIIVALEATQKENLKLKELVKIMIKYMSKFHDSNEDKELREIENRLIALTAKEE